MVILGVNGWPERSHDASACLIVDGYLAAYAEEERFIRIKHAFDHLPHNAIAYCLQSAKLSPDDIDVIAWGWDMPTLHNLHGRNFLYNQVDLNNLILPEKYFGKRKKRIKVEFINHHLAHAASVYCGRTSNEPMAIVVIDGSGEAAAVSIYLGQDGQLKLIRDFPVKSSLGLFYEAACQYLGFSGWDTGKLMGLASHSLPGQEIFFGRGDNSWMPHFSFTESKNGALDWGKEILFLWRKEMAKVWGEQKGLNFSYDNLKGRLNLKPALGSREEKIAASVQQELERGYLWYIKEALFSVPSRSLGLAGGVSLNCSANGLIQDSGLVSELCLHPAAYDAGTALGAAVMMLGFIPSNFFKSPYLGPDFSPAEIRNFLAANGLDFSEPADINLAVAESLAAGKIIGYFQGRMEIGPRALGARSILADPKRADNHTRVNNIKSRELWRPLAPAIIPAYSHEYFKQKQSSPYMLVRDFVRPEKINEILAVVHVDLSVRPQAVNQDWHPAFFDLLNKFNQQTGTPLLLNTSFNYEKEPIVCTPADAIRTFFSTALDELAIGPFLIKKNENHKKRR